MMPATFPIAAVLAASAASLQAHTAGYENWAVAALSVASVTGIVVAAVYAAKNRAELSAARGSAQAWREERDAERAKADRLEASLREETAARKASEARTNLVGLEKQVETNHAAVLAILDALKTAVLQQTAAVELIAKQNFDHPGGTHEQA